MKIKNKVAKAIYEARKEQALVKLNVRLKKNGQFSSVEGKVKEVKVSSEGEPYVVVQPKGNKHIQSVSLDNVLMVHKDGKLFKRS